MNRRPQTTEALLKAIRKNPRGRYQEWADAMGVESTSTVRYHLQKLAREGRVILHPGRARSVELLPEEGYSQDTVETAIEVLRAFATGDLQLPDDLAVELVGAAFDVVSMPGVTRITCEIETENPAQAVRSA